MPKSKGRKKTRKQKRRAKPVKTMHDWDSTIVFCTYTDRCVSLYKLSGEMAPYYEQNKLTYSYTMHNPPYGPYQIAPTDVNTKMLAEVPHLVLHRVGTHGWDNKWNALFTSVLRSRRRAGLKTTYFIDDFLMYMNDWISPRFMGLCDTVITLGYELKPFLEQKYGLRNIKQLRTHVDIAQYDGIQAGTLKPGTFNLVWFSMVSTGRGFMRMLFEKMDKLNDFKDVVFWCICPQAALNRYEFFTFRDVNTRYSEFLVPSGLIKLEKSADAIINPIHFETDNADFVEGVDRKFFMQAKSEVKYTHAGAASKPLITCATSPYEAVIQDGVNGFISDNPDEWIEYILTLKKDKDLADSIGKAARVDIENRYNCSDRFKEFTTIVMGEDDDSSNNPVTGPNLINQDYSIG